MSSIHDEMSSVFGQLRPDDQQAVLKLARSLVSHQPRGTLGSELTRFAGSIPPDELDEIEKIIERDCERIDESTW